MIFRSRKHREVNFAMREHVIYRLRDPRPERTVRYVGRTSLHLWYERLDFHVERAIWAKPPSPTSRLSCWIVALRAAGLDDPEIEHIEEATSADAIVREAHWIAHHRDVGDPILNANSGGAPPFAWTLPHLSLEERAARCADPDYGIIKGEPK